MANVSIFIKNHCFFISRGVWPNNFFNPVKYRIQTILLINISFENKNKKFTPCTLYIFSIRIQRQQAIKRIWLIPRWNKKIESAISNIKKNHYTIIYLYLFSFVFVNLFVFFCVSVCMLAFIYRRFFFLFVFHQFK